MSYLVAAALSSTPSSCPVELVLADPQIKVVRRAAAGFDNYIVSVDVTNRGRAGQNGTTRQHLELRQGTQTLGSQPIPPLGSQQSYVAAFRLQLPHQAKRQPLKVDFRYADDSPTPSRECTSTSDMLSVTL